MEAIDRFLADVWQWMPEGLKELVAGYDWETIGAGLGLLSLALLGLRSAARLISERRKHRRRENDLRRLELRVEAAKIERESRFQAENQRAEADFIAALRQSIADGAPHDALQLDWLTGLQPTLAEAYSLLSRHALAAAEDAAGLAMARNYAWGAVSAGVALDDLAVVIDAIDAAEQEQVFETYSESDLLAWKIANFAPESGAPAGADGLHEKNRHRIGAVMLISGSEEVEIQSAARASLTDRSAASREASSANEPQDDDRKHGAKQNASFRGRRKQLRAALEGSGEDETASVGPPHEPKGDGRSNVLALRKDKPEAAEAADDEVDGLASSATGRGDTPGPRMLRIRANAAHDAGLQGRHAEAELGFRGVWQELQSGEEKGQDLVDCAIARHNMAYEIARQGRPAEAKEHFRAILDELKSQNQTGDVRLLMLATRHDLGEALAAERNHTEAEREFRAVWEARRRPDVLGELHPATLWSKAQMLRARAEVKSKTA